MRGLNQSKQIKRRCLLIGLKCRQLEYFLVTYIHLAPLISYKSHSIISMSYFTFYPLFSLSSLLLATRFATWKDGSRDLCGIPVDFFPVYRDTALRTAIIRTYVISSLCSVSILRKSLRLQDYHGSNLTSLYLFVVLINNSCDTELKPGPYSLSVGSHFLSRTLREFIYKYVYLMFVLLSFLYFMY